MVKVVCRIEEELPEPRHAPLERLFHIKGALGREVAAFRRANPGLDQLTDAKKARALYEWMIPEKPELQKVFERVGLLDKKDKTNPTRSPAFKYGEEFNHPRSLLAGKPTSCMAGAVVGCAIARKIGLNSRVVEVVGMSHSCFSVNAGRREVILDPPNRIYNKRYKVRPMGDMETYYYVTACVLLEDGKPGESIPFFDKVLKENPGFVVAYNNRGGAKDDAGLVDEAIEDFEEAVRLDPGFSAAWGNLGNAKAVKGRYKGALKDLDKAIKLDPGNYIAFYNRGQAKAELGNIAGAIDDIIWVQILLRGRSDDKMNRLAEEKLTELKSQQQKGS
jgi:tetratricopeptide (TPR) repeat protein